MHEFEVFLDGHSKMLTMTKQTQGINSVITLDNSTPRQSQNVATD